MSWFSPRFFLTAASSALLIFGNNPGADASAFKAAPGRVRTGAPRLVPTLASAALSPSVLGPGTRFDFDLSGTLKAPAIPVYAAPEVPASLAAGPLPSAQATVPAPRTPRTLIERIRDFKGGLLKNPASQKLQLDNAFDASRSDKEKTPVFSSDHRIGPASDEVLSWYGKLEEDLPETAQGLPPTQIMSLWWSAYSHKIAGIDDPAKMAKYDPKGVIGFCFGRAMAAHLLARQMGLSRDSVKKLFVIGDLREGDVPQWRFHVATLVKGIDGEWYAIDPILQGPMPAKTWIAAIQRTFDKNKKANFYLTPGDSVLPDVRTTPLTPADESGERMIELSFEPNGKAGFTNISAFDPKAFAPDTERVAKHLLGAVAGETRFDFTGITINGDWYDYNGYFIDLLRELVEPSKPARDIDLLAKPGMAGPSDLSPPKRAPKDSRPLGLNLGKLQDDKKD